LNLLIVPSFGSAPRSFTQVHLRGKTLSVGIHLQWAMTVRPIFPPQGNAMPVLFKTVEGLLGLSPPFFLLPSPPDSSSWSTFFDSPLRDRYFLNAGLQRGYRQTFLFSFPAVREVRV